MPTIGIDLGTTNSLCAYWSDDGPVIISNILGSNLTPSIISVDDNGEILIGEVAKERLITHPHLTVSCFKRYMGTEKKYNLGQYTFTPIELSSFVLKALKADAEAYFKEEVKEAVISVPAYFNDKQRKATKQAAELAGFYVERLISEPTAAAIAYGLHQEKDETKFMVFDLGGGTFDVSILELFEGIMEVKAIAGDNYLGGEDFTELIVHYFTEREHIDISNLDSKEISALYKQAEMCKRMLGQNNLGSMTFNYRGMVLNCEISRSEYEKLMTPLLLRLRQPIERSMRDVGLKPSDLDSVILIGGATRMPIIKSVVGKMFGMLPGCNINPDEAVALGAAIQVALKERNESLKEIILTDVCPYTLGISVAKEASEGKYESGYYFPIIERNTPIPVSRVERLCALRDGQTAINVNIYQGENRKVEGNIYLGILPVSIPPATRGESVIDVRYTYDINGILEVEVIVLKTGEKKTLVIEQNAGAMTKEEIEQRLISLQEIKIHPRDKMENKLILAKGERLFEEALGDRRNYIGELIYYFESILDKQNELDIKKAAKEVKEKLESLEGWYDY
ncbi:MAG: molecular chaperone HscC [Herbinix sp.]|jgi:molecular chaperone HscC|nr:molecular chaperone HscC [Herbinix sp.]